MTLARAQYCPKCNGSIKIKRAASGSNAYTIYCEKPLCWAFNMKFNVIKKFAIQLWREIHESRVDRKI